MAERVLSEADLNRALLERQFLLRQAKLPIPRAVEALGGIQAQYAPSTYIGLWTRLHAFRKEQLDRELYDRSVVQGTLMRITIHLVSKEDYPLLCEGVREARRQAWVAAHRRRGDADSVVQVVERARNLLADGPMHRTELMKRLGCDSSTWNGVGLWIDLLRVPPSGTWNHRRADIYALAEDWIGQSKVAPAQGIEHLIRRYLGGFGPASLSDIASWAGVTATTLKPVLERLGLRRFVDETGKLLVDLPDAPLPPADTPAPVRFLPVWDATLLVHARRTGILPEQYRPVIFSTKTPQSVATFLVDGKVAGKWRIAKDRVETEPFEKLPRPLIREVAEEADRLTEFYAERGA